VRYGDILVPRGFFHSLITALRVNLLTFISDSLNMLSVVRDFSCQNIAQRHTGSHGAGNNLTPLTRRGKPIVSFVLIIAISLFLVDFFDL
jgi:hypothetical protein